MAYGHMGIFVESIPHACPKQPCLTGEANSPWPVFIFYVWLGHGYNYSPPEIGGVRRV